MTRKVIRTLAKPSLCSGCGTFISRGEQYRWVKGRRSVASYMSGTQGISKVECMKIVHARDCVAEKVAAEKDAELISIMCLASEIGATKDQLDAIFNEMTKSEGLAKNDE